MNRIKELRKSLGLSIEQLSEELKKADYNISASSISKYERGKRNPKIETWQKLADFFDVSVPYLQGLSNVTYMPWDVTYEEGSTISRPVTDSNERFKRAMGVLVSGQNKHTSERINKLKQLSEKLNNDQKNHIADNLYYLLQIGIKAYTGDKEEKEYLDRIDNILLKALGNGIDIYEPSNFDV